MPEDTRILIVDDEKMILETFSELLEEYGYYTRTASNAADALRLVSEDTFTLAFIDQFLGPDRGLDLMARMSEISPDLYYILMTANGNTDLAVDALKQGASDFIGKPFFVRDMLKSIDYVNRKRELDRQKKELLSVLELKLEEKTEELRKIYFPVLSSLAQAMEKKDTGTYGHSMRVRRHSGLIAAALDLNVEDRENLQAAAMLHDLGKIGTSDFILGKPGPLTADEIHIVRSHPQKGVEILSPLKQIFSQLDHILPAILHHHENYDGSGYPSGLSGENIPLLARIITVADAYDAILSDRPYRAASGHNKAIIELQQHAGRQFDGNIVEAFAEGYTKYDQPFDYS